MGNETSLLKKCHISAKPLYTSNDWELFDATQENQCYSAFVFNDSDYCNDVTKWKHVRHPYLVKCYEVGIYKNKKYILTEPVIPVQAIWSKFHQFSKLSGLYNIGDALSFLHKICNISVNNLSIDSIYISKNDPNELWKLGSLYWCSTPTSEDDKFIKNLISFHTRHGTLKSLPPEDQDYKNSMLIKSASEIHRRDVHAFVNLISELFYNDKNRPKLADILVTSDNEVTDHNLMARTLIDSVKMCPPNERPPVSDVLDNRLFKNCSFVQIRHFLSNFSSYSDQEKYSFLNNLVQNMKQFSDQSLVVNIFAMIVSSRFIMSNRMVYKHVMPYFLIPLASDEQQTDQTSVTNRGKENTYSLTNGELITLSPFIERETFGENIIRHIINLFCVHDYKIRLLLLNYLPHYGSFISKSCLKKIVMPQILLGIKDSDKELVSLTLKALAVLVDLFGVIPVLGGSNRSRYFTSGISEEITENQRSSTVCDTRRSSMSSINYDQKINSLICERSSPDGDETRESNILLNENTGTKFSTLNVPHEQADDDWPDWEEGQVAKADTSPGDNKSLPAPRSGADSNGKACASLPTNQKFQTFDIKEIDFKEFGYTKEIDNLFLDMAPVVNFKYQAKSNHPPVKIEKPTRARQPDATALDLSDQQPIDTSLFAADQNDQDLDIESSGWNDSLDWNDQADDDTGNAENLDSTEPPAAPDTIEENQPSSSSQPVKVEDG